MLVWVYTIWDTDNFLLFSKDLKTLTMQSILQKSFNIYAPFVLKQYISDK